MNSGESEFCCNNVVLLMMMTMIMVVTLLMAMMGCTDVKESGKRNLKTEI